jgi:hypothetical protein
MYCTLRGRGGESCYDLIRRSFGVNIIYYMRIEYSVHSTTISLEIQELAIHHKVCANVALYYVGMRRAHGLGLYWKIAYDVCACGVLNLFNYYIPTNSRMVYL